MRRALTLYLTVMAGLGVSAGLVDLVRLGKLSGKTYEDFLDSALQLVSGQFQIESTAAELIANPIMWLVAIPLQNLMLFVASVLAVLLGKAIGGRIGSVTAILLVMFWVPVSAYVFGVLPAAAGSFGVESTSQLGLATLSVLFCTLVGAGIGTTLSVITGPLKPVADRSGISQANAGVTEHEIVHQKAPLPPDQDPRSVTSKVAVFLGGITGTGAFLATIAASKYVESVADAFKTVYKNILEADLHPSLIDAAEDILANSHLWLASIVFQYLGLYVVAIAIIFLAKVVFRRTGAIVGTIVTSIFAASLTASTGALTAVAGSFGASAGEQVLLAVANILLATAAGLSIGATAGVIWGKSKVKAEPTSVLKSEMHPTDSDEPAVPAAGSNLVRKSMTIEDVNAQIEARRQRLLGDND